LQLKKAKSMNDQATTLRNLAVPETVNGSVPLALAQMNAAVGNGAHRTRTLAITGGKGGVGKSNVAVNLALELGALGWRVSLFDADLALANTDMLLGVNPQYHLGHVLTGERSLEEVIIETTNGVRLIPGGSGVEELANLSLAQQQQLIAELSAMEAASDFMIIDTAAGIGHNVTSVLRAAAEVIVVTTPDPTAVVDAYATIKVLHRYCPAKPVWVLVNNAVGFGDAEEIFGQIHSAAERFLQHPLEYIGTIPRDEELAEAVRRQIPVVNYAPQAPASRSFRLIAKQLDQARRCSVGSAGPSASFWQLLSEPAN
jgi:flagellar biosynthesis protein FlhG